MPRIAPQMKRPVATATVVRSSRLIFFYGTDEAIEDFRQFGAVTTNAADCPMLSVDARFDFDEVVKYIETWEEHDA